MGEDWQIAIDMVLHGNRSILNKTEVVIGYVLEVRPQNVRIVVIQNREM